MATKLYTGMDGALLLQTGGTWAPVAKVKSWSFTANLKTLDITTIGDVVTQNVPGVANYSGNATLLYYQKSGGTTDPKNDAGVFLQTLMRDGSGTGTAAHQVYPGNKTGITDDEFTSLKLNLSNGDTAPGGTSVDRYIWLQCLITSASLTVQSGDIVTTQISFVNRTKLSGVKLGTLNY